MVAFCAAFSLPITSQEVVADKCGSEMTPVLCQVRHKTLTYLTDQLCSGHPCECLAMLYFELLAAQTYSRDLTGMT